MAVTIEKRPIGVVLGTCVTASINSDYSSVFATVNKTSHNLQDGDYVYIQSNVENYNGFWQIEVTNANEFLLIDNPYVEWIVDADITYCPGIQTHGWSCVHLPIVYEVSNTKYPTNSVDTARTISSITDDNGLVNANLSGSLGTFEDLSFVKISNCPDPTYDGVYQILDKLATNDVTLNLDYASTPASAITGATIQLYYSNYNIVVRVYVGINSSHEWADQKPYELAATLELIPDENNRSKFSINEIVKSYIQTKNNLLLATLPNNIDVWTQFYIEVGEQYDTSNGYTVTTFEGAFASDQSALEGYAVNAMLPFKNIHSGYLSEYLMTNNAAKFLTLFTIPVLFCCGDDTPDCYQDISFLCPPVDIGFDLMDEYPLSGWTNEGVPLTIAWTTGAVPFVTMGDGDTSDRLSESGITGLPAGTYTLNYNITSAVAGSNFMSVQVRFKKAGVAVGSPNPVTISLSTGANIGSTSVTLTDVIDEIEVQVIEPGGAGVNTTTLNSLNIHVPDLVSSVDSVLKQWYNNGQLLLSQNETIPDYDAGVYRLELTPNITYDRLDITLLDSGLGTLSETKQFEIDCGCSEQEIRLSWINNLGGFDYWTFKGETGHTIDITSAGETKQNIFPEWPKSYGGHADTIRKQTFRESANRKFIFSQFLTQDQADALAYIKSSPLVQIVNSRQDKRTVIVDTDSFSKYEDGDKTYTISFNILFTDDIPSQRV